VLKRIEESMKRLDVDVLDFYQVWNMHNDDCYEQTMRPGGFLDGVLKARELGLVRHIGVTSHYKPDALAARLDDLSWCEVLLVTYNVLNRSYAGVLEKARSLGIGTIVMNPVAGGRFGENSEVFRPLLERVGSVSCPDLAVRYVLSNPNVDTIITGIHKTADVDDTLASAARPGFTGEQLREIDAFIEGLSRENIGFCTACGYCMPCPEDVNIPKVMEAVYNDKFLGFHEGARKLHRDIKTAGWIKGTNAEACTDCGACAEKCTQKLAVPEEMEFARTRLT
jgi:predicted aldo/keto reductase-like oxidoreductase